MGALRAGCPVTQRAQTLLACGFRLVRQLVGSRVEFPQVAAILSQQLFEAGHEIVVSGDGIELSIVELTGEPVIIFRIAAPLCLQLGVFLPQLLKQRLLLPAPLFAQSLALFLCRFDPGALGLLVAVERFQPLARIRN